VIGQLVKQIRPNLEPIKPALMRPIEESKLSPVVRLSNHLDLDRRTHMCVEFIVERVRESSILVGKNPLGIAGASVILACHASKTCSDIPSIREISKFSQIGEPTIRKHLRELVSFSENLFHPKFEMKIKHTQLKCTINAFSVRRENL